MSCKTFLIRSTIAFLCGNVTYMKLVGMRPRFSYEFSMTTKTKSQTEWNTVKFLV